MADQIFPKGVRFFNKNEKQPDFVVASLLITPDELVAFCKDNAGLLTEYNGNKQLKLQVLKSKEGNIYCAVDCFKPEKKAENQANQYKKVDNPIDLGVIDDLPF